MALLLTSALDAEFAGPYAPELWTFFTEAGGFIDKHTDDALVLVGGDVGLGGDTSVVITAAATGRWSFHWEYSGADNYGGFDAGYYVLNGTLHFLSDIGYSSVEGDVALDINAGDVFGYQVKTIDGIFGPGTLTITDFSAPVPAAGALALLGMALVPFRRRCERAPPR
jgi:hypothetical protein